MRYKWSRYNYFEFDEKNKKFVCYNTKSGAVLFGNANLFAASDLKKMLLVYVIMLISQIFLKMVLLFLRIVMNYLN